MEQGFAECPSCGTHEVALKRECQNSACALYAEDITVYEGWVTPSPVNQGEAEILREALALIREPTGEMLQAGNTVWLRGGNERQIFQAMIDAAMEPECPSCGTLDPDDNIYCADVFHVTAQGGEG